MGLIASVMVQLVSVRRPVDCWFPFSKLRSWRCASIQNFLKRGKYPRGKRSRSLPRANWAKLSASPALLPSFSRRKGRYSARRGTPQCSFSSALRFHRVDRPVHSADEARSIALFFSCCGKPDVSNYAGKVASRFCRSACPRRRQLHLQYPATGSGTRGSRGSSKLSQ